MIRFSITGQLKSGKNNMGITRSGKHYPRPEWARWRDDVVDQLRAQDKRRQAIDAPCSIVVSYTAGDRIRRDVPGILDAMFHCFERADIIADDRWFVNVKWLSYYEAGKPRASIRIY